MLGLPKRWLDDMVRSTPAADGAEAVPAGGLVRYSANLPWLGLPIAAEVAGRVGLPVAIEHDVRAAVDG